jgi:hypothetical protein
MGIIADSRGMGNECRVYSPGAPGEFNQWGSLTAMARRHSDDGVDNCLVFSSLPAGILPQSCGRDDRSISLVDGFDLSGDEIFLYSPSQCRPLNAKKLGCACYVSPGSRQCKADKLFLHYFEKV